MACYITMRFCHLNAK